MPIFKIVISGKKTVEKKVIKCKEVMNLTAKDAQSAIDWALGICKYENIKDLSIKNIKQINL